MIFAHALKKLREAKKIGSKELSRRLGKGEAYISQIENGRIKNIDYEAAFEILKQLGYEKDKIDNMLEHFGILSPEKEQYMLEQALKHIEEEEKMLQDPEQAQKLYKEHELIWLEAEKEELKDINNFIHGAFEKLIDNDFSMARNTLESLHSFFKSREDLDFFYSLISVDYSSLPQERRKELIDIIKEFVSEHGKEA